MPSLRNSATAGTPTAGYRVCLEPTAPQGMLGRRPDRQCWVRRTAANAAWVEAAKGRLHREGVPLGRGRHAAVYLCVVMKDWRGRPEALERAVDAEEDLPEELGDGRDALQ